MKIVGNGRMITRDASNTFYENGAVAMDGSTIVMAGETEEVKKAYPDAEFIDAKGGVIMPAFINAHEHIYSSFARGLSIKGYNPQGFLDILDGQWWTIDPVSYTHLAGFLQWEYFLIFIISIPWKRIICQSLQTGERQWKPWNQAQIWQFWTQRTLPCTAMTSWMLRCV